MGLIKALAGATGGVLADQWKEYFYCDSIDANTLIVKGSKRVGDRSSNTKASDNIITQGSLIAVADGQCMIIVDQGKVAEVCAEPGEYTYDASTEPSVFAGGLGHGLSESFKTLGKRFTFGGEPAKDQRVYYVNTKELIGNKYGTAAPIPYRVIDEGLRINLTVNLKCFGEYSYRITDPLRFYANVSGNVSDAFTRDKIDSQLKSELMTALQPAFVKVSMNKIPIDMLPGYTSEIADILNKELSAKWSMGRGIEVVSFGISSVTADEKDMAKIQEIQEAATYSDDRFKGGRMTAATANAMQAAAGNESGAMTGFLGMGMAMNQGGVNMSSFGNNQPPVNMSGAGFGAGYSAGMNTNQNMQGNPNMGDGMNMNQTNPNMQNMQAGANIGGNNINQGNPATVNAWVCQCGNSNQGKFCSECGQPKPAGALQYKCDKCGWEPADPTHPPKFCPECGDPFGDEDVVG